MHDRIKLMLILCFCASGTALADEAAQCRANGGTYLTGTVTKAPVFAHGHPRDGVELSHTHLRLLSDQDGRSYDVAIDNVFATGYDAAGERVPTPHQAWRKAGNLRQAVYPRRAGHRLGAHQLRSPAERSAT